MGKKIKRPITYVKWVDSASYSDQQWYSLSDHDHGIATIEAVGILVHEDKNFISLVMNISKQDSVVGDMAIPKVAILKRKVLSA